MLKIKDDVDLKELEKFGFKHRYEKVYEYIREIDGMTVYRIYTTNRHHILQIEILQPVIIAGSLQKIIYNLIQAGLVEKIEEEKK